MESGIEDLRESRVFEEYITESKWNQLKLQIKNLSGETPNLLAPLISYSKSKKNFLEKI